MYMGENAQIGENFASNSTNLTMNKISNYFTTKLIVTTIAPTNTSNGSLLQMRLALTLTHILLVSLGI